MLLITANPCWCWWYSPMSPLWKKSLSSKWLLFKTPSFLVIWILHDNWYIKSWWFDICRKIVTFCGLEAIFHQPSSWVSLVFWGFATALTLMYALKSLGLEDEVGSPVLWLGTCMAYRCHGQQLDSYIVTYNYIYIWPIKGNGNPLVVGVNIHIITTPFHDGGMNISRMPFWPWHIFWVWPIGQI